MQKKALYVRFKGIPEEVIFLSFNIAKTLINKGFCVIARNEVSLPPHFQNFTH
jgi:hypothetical protein